MRPAGPASDPATGEVTPRAFCYRCHRAGAFCICAAIPCVEHRTGVIVLQHPRERFHPFGTARFVRLGLARGEVRVIAEGAPPADLPQGSALLFPDGAQPLATLAPDEQPAHLIVLDGTWSQARRMLRVHPWLHSLPRVALQPTSPSNYRIRRPPSVECLSTIESIVAALAALEPANHAIDGLLGAFQAMVDAQIEFLSASPRCSRFRRRGRAPTLNPLHRPTRDLVICHAEGLRVDAAQPRELICLVARRQDGSASLRLVPRRVDDRPTDIHLEHMGMRREELRNGLTADELRARWRAFRRADDLLVAWQRDTFTLLSPIGDLTPHVTLRPLFGQLCGAARGSVHDVVTRLDLGLPQLGADRASQWLAAVSALTGHLRDLHADTAGDGGAAP